MSTITISIRWVFLALVLLSSLSLSVAQDDSTQHPLLEMLSLIPDIDVIREGYNSDLGWYPEISYVDYSAIEKYSPFGMVIEDASAFLELSEEEQAQWVSGAYIRRVGFPQLPLPNEQTGNEIDPATLKRGGGPPVVEAINTSLGFDYFAIDRGMTFGATPAGGLIFGIPYDMDSVDTALQTRDYELQSDQDAVIWCHIEGGCGSSYYDRTNIEAENIFDDRFGRKPPIIAAPAYLYTVLSEDLVETFIDAQVGEIPSLADADDYRVIVEVITDSDRYSGDLLNARFIAGATVYRDISANDLAEQSGVPGQGLQSIWEGFGTIPSPELVVFADRQEPSGQVVMMAILYSNTEQAQAAHEELAHRINDFTGPFDIGQPSLISDQIAETTLLEPYIQTDESSGMAVLVISYTVGTIPDDNTGIAYYENDLMEIWINAVYSGTFFPFWNIDVSN